MSDPKATEPKDTPAQAATRARCRTVQLQIDHGVTFLGPVILASGQLNSLQDASPPTPGGGYVLACIEAIHGGECSITPCSCGAQALLDRMVLK